MHLLMLVTRPEQYDIPHDYRFVQFRGDNQVAIIPYKSHLGPLPKAKSYRSPAIALKDLYRWVDCDCWVVDRQGASWYLHGRQARIKDRSCIQWDDCQY